VSTETRIAAIAVAVLMAPILLIAAGLTVLTAPFTAPLSNPADSADTNPGQSGGASAPSEQAIADIPRDYLPLYQQAAATCPGLSWSVLAAIGKIESDHGRSPLPGVSSGSNAAGTQGPLQFLPDTFAQYAYPIPPGGANPPSPYNPANAIYAAARLLCQNGARDNREIQAALFAYNHDQRYVDQVLTQARQYQTTTPTTSPPATPSTNTPGKPSPAPLPAEPVPAPTQAAAVAVNYARSQIGTPYHWGGNGPNQNGGWDCSGLTKASYDAAGIQLPRTAQTQYNTGPQLPAATTPQPGDLIFYGDSATAINHVGMAISSTQIIDAPNEGQLVRIDRLQQPKLVGITRPTKQD
jgi:cell wall-associated NlpC family hydrolase